MSAPTLREVQQWMKSQIRPGSPGGRAAALNPQRGSPGEERLAVYAGGYQTRMREALAEVYEAVHRVLGEGPFEALSRAYAERHPSHDYNLSLSGRHLPEFLAASSWSERLPFLPDLARLEWAVCLAFHAQERPPCDLRRLAAAAPEAWARVRVVFQPSVAVVSSRWPILDIWAVRQEPPGAINIALEGRPQDVLVCRRELQVRCEALEHGQALVLEPLLAGQPLGQALEALQGAEGREESPVAAWFAGWATRGLIAELDLPLAPSTGCATIPSP